MQQNTANFQIKDAQIDQFFKTFRQEPLGSGRNSVVYLTQHIATGVYFALKEPRKDQSSQQSIMNEINIFMHLWQTNSQEFPRCIPFMEKFSETHKILMEYMKKGSLFDILITSGKFDERMSRTIAINLYNAILHLHYLGVTHFDLKPDNIMFNEKMMLKICDLGYANNPVGYTQGYAPPEQLNGTITDPYKCDIFAFGIILFIMVMGFPPFQHYNDSWFTMIYNQQWDLFWNKVKENGKTDPSVQFKQLLANVIVVDSKKRISLQDLSKIEWFTMTKATDQECQQELLRRIELANIGYYKC